MKLLAKMLALVATKFQDKLDKQGVPYFEHCHHVMKTCGLTDENHLCIALGHDLLEDTDVTLDYLEREFNQEISEGILILTHHKDYTNYEQYIGDIILSKRPNLIRIKLADLRHNMDASRLKGWSIKDGERMLKYMNAIGQLKQEFC